MPEEKSPEQQIFSSRGLPFASEAAARAEITRRGLDGNFFVVKSFEGGFIVAPKPTKIAEKYYKVTFSMKGRPDDDEDVTLVVNGETLLIQRGKRVIIPERFKECAEHATYPIFRQKPNESRKQVGVMQTFLFSVDGEATEEEYKKQLADGNRISKEALAQASKLIE